MADIRNAASDRVILAHESERGYVPPRHRGVAIARDYFEKQVITPQDVLVVQADADTTYVPGYISALLAAARTIQGSLLEGVAQTLPAFEQLHPGYHRLAEQADLAIEPFLVDEADEVIVDDKVAAYRLSDYFEWGGHQREYNVAGDEIYAETSRLYLRGKMVGAGRLRVADARAFPSRRKVELDPVLYFATAGFPREADWVRRWRLNHSSDVTFDAFESATASVDLAEPIFLRRAHSLLLFGVMPAYVARLLGRAEPRHLIETPLGELVDTVADITAADVASHPARLFEACLPLMETHRSIFEQCIQHATT
jgi:hypothetical protein